MKTRIIIIISLFTILSQLLTAKQASISELLEQIRRESYDLALLEDEVEHYRALLNKQEQIKKLYQQKRLNSVREMFETDLEALDALFAAEDTERAVQKIWEINRIYKGINELDIKDYFPEQRMLYYEARLHVIDGNYNRAKRILEPMLIDNIDQQYRNDIVLLLEEIYFHTKNFNDLIAVFPVYRGINSPRQRWWLGQALYNTDRLSEAATVFNRLEGDAEYDLRARCMSALIKYQYNQPAQAINDLVNLKFRSSTSNPHYNFINLSLARLYAITANRQEAINLYDQYVQLQKDVPDDILYEIATLYRNFGEYSQAIYYYDLITKKQSGSNYYIAAVYFTAITEQDRGNHDKARGYLAEIIDRNKSIMQAVNQKYSLMENYAGHLHNLIAQNLTPERRRQIDDQLNNLENQFQSNRDEIDSLTRGLQSNRLLYLRLLEDEYFAHTITLANYEAFVRYARNPMLKRLPPVKNYEFSQTDSSFIYLQIIDYLDELKDKSSEIYRLAKFMSEQKISQVYYRDVWFEISDLGTDYNLPPIIELAEYADSLITQNLNTIADLENWAFKKNLSDQQKKLAEEKIKSIETNNKILEDEEHSFINQFSDLITPILSLKVEQFAASQNDIRNHYIETITSLVEDLTTENQMYENTIIDILFRRSKMLDQEFTDYRKKITNENN